MKFPLTWKKTLGNDPILLYFGTWASDFNNYRNAEFRIILMSITLNKSKTIHPNRLVTRHEEFLVNKNLANKVTHVKSTIKSGNKHFEDILNRRKKE